MEQMFDVMNQYLFKNHFTQHLSMRTYKVLPLSQRPGLVEWYENSVSIGVYLVGRGTAGEMELTPSTNQAWLPMEFKRQCEKFKPVF